MPPLFKLWPIMAASQTFDQTTQKNSDIPTLDEALTTKMTLAPFLPSYHHCRFSLCITLGPYAFAHSKATTLSVSTHSSGWRPVLAVCNDLRLFFHGRNCHQRFANAFADSIKTILRDGVCEVLQEEVPSPLLGCASTLHHQHSNITPPMPHTFIIVIKKSIHPLRPLAQVPHLVLSLDPGTSTSINTAAIASTSSIIAADYMFSTVVSACSSSTIASAKTSNDATSSLFSFF